MAHDVFISYAAEDHGVAEEVCGALEAGGVKCWIAPRDVPYGTDYEDAIVDAINASPLLVLILSSRSNASPHVKREIQNACAEGSTTRVIPLRIEDIPYSKGLQYYLRSTQWLDASTPPLEQHLRRLVQHVRTHLPHAEEAAATVTDGQPRPPVDEAVEGGRRAVGEARPFEYDARGSTDAGASADDEHHVRRSSGERRKPFPFMWLVGGAVGLLAVVLIGVFAFRASNGGGNANLPEASKSPDANAVASGSPKTTPTPRRTPSPTPTPTTTPTPTPSPSLTPPRNYNFRLPSNTVIIRRPTPRP